MASSASFVADNNREDAPLSYVKRLRALKDSLNAARRSPGKRSELHTLANHDSSSLLGGSLSEDERRRAVSRIGSAMPRLGGGRRYESGKVVSEAANLKAPSSQEDIDILRGSDRSMPSYQNQLQSVPGTIKEENNVKSGGDSVTSMKFNMENTGKQSVAEDLRSVISSLNEARSSIWGLKQSLEDLQTSAVKSQRVYGQQLADVESTIERLRLMKSEKDAELQYLRKQNESLNASCRLYLEERNAAKIKNEGYLAKIKDLELECAQMNDIVVRPEREMVSDCGGKKVSVMYERKGEGTPENAIGEELQVQERVATAATTTLPTLEDTVTDGDSNPTEDEIHATEFDQ